MPIERAFSLGTMSELTLVREAACVKMHVEMKKELDSRFTEKHYSRLLHKIDSNMSSEESWLKGRRQFGGFHHPILKRSPLYPKSLHHGYKQ